MSREAKFHLKELHQSFSDAARVDYGSGLRIGDLEKMLENERVTDQRRMNSVAQSTQQEFMVMQDWAVQIKEEAREAIMASENQRFQDRELMTDEVMNLKYANEKLIAECSTLQQNMIRTSQKLNHERT